MDTRRAPPCTIAAHASAVLRQFHALAFNPGNFLRTLATPEQVKRWPVTSLNEKLIKIGAKAVSHGRYVAFKMAGAAMLRNLFAGTLRLLGSFALTCSPRVR